MLAAMKLGLVLIPAMPQLGEADIADRLERGEAQFLVAHGRGRREIRGGRQHVERIAVGEAGGGWRAFGSLISPDLRFQPDGPTRADDPMLLYFTSGTTARSKLVLHSHASYPIGRLSTMYGLGLKPSDVHLNISSPGWAKHAWSSVFAPWNAGATVVALAGRFGRAPRSTRWSRIRSPRSARPRPSGACSSRKPRPVGSRTSRDQLGR